MSARGRKGELLDACRTQHTAMIQQLKEVMLDAQESANEYGPPKDRYDPYRNQLMRRKDMFGQQLQRAMEQEKALDIIDPEKEFEVVDFGAVVVTDSQNIFIAAALGKVMFDGEEYFVISPHVPIYEAMKGKKPGDTYQFKEKRGKILDVY